MNKREFKKQLFKRTGCKVQHDGWCCGTCFFNLNDICFLPFKLYLNNQDWQSLLLYRGDTKEADLDNLPKDYKKSIDKIWEIIK